MRTIRICDLGVIMKIKISLLTILLIILTSCQNQPVQTEKLKIVTTFFPITDLVQRIVGDTTEVQQLLPNSDNDAHHWEPSPKDIVLLESADVFVYNGANMETWVDDVLASIQNEGLVVINASKNIEVIDGHEHDIDPHTWSTPLNAIEQLKTIEAGLREAYPEKKETFKTNLDLNSISFNDLHLQYQKELAPITNRTLVVQHEAYGYLADQYDLQQIGIEGLVPTSEPDANRMVEIINLVKEKGVKTIFFESNVSDKVAQTLSNETGAQTLVLSTLSNPTTEHNDLLELMRSNLDQLVKGLK